MLKSLLSSKPESADGFVFGKSLCPNTAKKIIPTINIGIPTFAYSKKPNDIPISCIADCAIKLPGAPISDKLPPIAAANTSGISNLDLEYPDLAATPITTGISTAAVPVLDNTPLIKPTITMIAIISCFSLLAKCVTTPPILLAIPVSNNAPPTINIDTKSITLLSIKPENAVFQSNTLVTTRPTQTIIDVTPNGSFSHTNMTIANNKNNNVIVA